MNGSSDDDESNKLIADLAVERVGWIRMTARYRPQLKISITAIAKKKTYMLHEIRRYEYSRTPTHWFLFRSYCGDRI